MQEEALQKQFPTLICSAHSNSPIVLVSLNQQDIHKSHLLCSRCVTQEIDGFKNKTKENLVVIEDFLVELTKKSPLAYTPHQLSTVVKQSYAENQKQFDQRLNAQLNSYKTLGENLKSGYLETCKQLVSQLSTQAESHKESIKNANSFFQNTLQSDPEADASIPKPNEILRKINDLRSSEQLPDYLFDLSHKLKAWNNEAPANLLNWTNRREEYYRNQLSEQLNYNFQNQLVDVAVQFWNRSINQLGEQVIQIIQDDPSLQSKNYLDLNLNTPQSLNLVTNSMITEHARLVYTIDKDLSVEDGKSVGQALENLTHLQVLQLDWQLGSGKAQGLSHVARSISNIKQLRVLQFRIHGVSLSAVHTKEFFLEFKDVNFPHLEELSFDVINSTIPKDSVQHIARAIKQIGNENVSRLNLDFRQNQLTEDFGVALGDVLNSFRNLNSLVINLSGYSLRQNNIKDKGIYLLLIKYLIKGIEALVQSLGNFGNSLVNLNLNFGYNNLTDSSALALQRAFQTSKWNNLKHLSLSFQRNKITARGVRKLSKV